VTFEVGGASGPEDAFQRHQGHEWGYVVSGTLHVTIGFEDYVLGPGDSISIDSMVPHRLSNQGPEPVHGIWFVLGRHTGSGSAGASTDAGAWLDPLHGVAR
jgi:quercetin dioxygenase-like cupin family protein